MKPINLTKTVGNSDKSLQNTDKINEKVFINKALQPDLIDKNRQFSLKNKQIEVETCLKLGASVQSSDVKNEPLQTEDVKITLDHSKI